MAMKMHKVIIVLGVLTIASMAEAQGVTIGPGTPCTVKLTEPTVNNDATPLLVPILSYDFYIDPPIGGPVIGVTLPTFSVLRSAMALASNGLPGGATATTSICNNVRIPLTNGNHTISASAVDAGGKSPGSPVVPFVFLPMPSASPANLILR